jgi:hypothetical protein
MGYKARPWVAAGVGDVKQIWIFIVGFTASFAVAPAFAEDLTAGKTPAQLFRSDCGECHRSPNGLARARDVSGLAAFLREHYTTKSETADALAAYVSGFASTGTAARNRGTALPGRERTRGRSEGDTPATAVNVPADAKPVDDPRMRRRRAASVPAEGEKGTVRDDGEVPRPPRVVGTASPKTSPPPKSNTPTRSQPHDADDPISRLRSYLSSGLSSENATAQAGRTGAPKTRKRRAGTDEVQPGAGASGDAPAASEVPAAVAAPAAVPPPTDVPPDGPPAEQQ